MIDDERKKELEDLGDALTELRESLGHTFTEARARLAEERRIPVAPDMSVSPAAVPALLDFLRALPRIVGQSISGDDDRVETARQSLEALQQELATGGIDLDERFTGFADRLAGLRREMEAKRNEPSTPPATPDQDGNGRLGAADTDPSNSGPNL